jgi:hypothetical protein
MQNRCYESTAKEAAMQQPLLSNGFADKHVSTATVAQQ